MKGKDLIKFIQDNKLEDMEILDGEYVNQTRFGTKIPVNDGKGNLSYIMDMNMPKDKELVIEVCQPNYDGNDNDYFYPSREEALKLRGLN